MSFDLQGPGTVLSAGQKQSEFQVQGAESVAGVPCHPQPLTGPQFPPNTGNQLRLLRTVIDPSWPLGVGPQG